MIDKIVFDVDGVLLAFDKAFEKYVHQQNTKLLKKDDIKLGSIKHFEWSFLHSDMFAKMEPLINPKLFNKLCAGAEVHLVTNLPTACIDKRAINLQKLGFEFDSLHVGGFQTYKEDHYPTKAEVCIELFGRWTNFLFIDDYDLNCQEVAFRLPKAKVIMIKGLHDLVVDNNRFLIVDNWQELEKEILSLRSAHKSA